MQQSGLKKSYETVIKIKMMLPPVVDKLLLQFNSKLIPM